DGSRFAGASAGPDVSEATVWDVATGKAVFTIRGHTAPVSAMAFSPDGRRLVSAAAGQDQSIKVWDAETGREILTLPGLATTVNSVAFRSDGSQLFAAGSDGTVKVWDATPLAGSR